MEDESTQELNEEVGSDLDEGVEEDESLSSEDSADDTDWKAEYEKAAEERENYKTALAQKRQLRKKPEPVVEESFEEQADEDKPLTRSEFLQMQGESKANSLLESLVPDSDKRKLVKLYYDTRIRQTGTSDDAIRADLETALDLVDVKKLRKTTSELARAANQDKTPPFGGSSSDRASAGKAHKFSNEQVASLTDSAKRLNADPAKFIAEAWKNQQGR